MDGSRARGKKNFEFHKMSGTARVAEDLPASK